MLLWVVSSVLRTTGRVQQAEQITGRMLGVARRMDVNCDIGETSYPWHESHEPELMGLITSANVACGGHAGDEGSMHAVCQQAAHLGVTVGAQVSYPDRANFGRLHMNLDPVVLADTLHHQFFALNTVARLYGTTVSYIKPHGALYNTIVRDTTHANVVVGLALRHGLALFGLPNSATESLAAEQGVRFVREWFADRGYLSSGELAPRSRPDALVTDQMMVKSRVVQLIRDGVVECVDGASIRVECETICVHSDTPGAAYLLRAVREALTNERVIVSAA